MKLITYKNYQPLWVENHLTEQKKKLENNLTLDPNGIIQKTRKPLTRPLWYDIIPKRKCGIYKIVNKIDGKSYIGSSGSIDDGIRGRMKSHRKQLNKGTHANIHFQRAWDKYGEDCFDFLYIKETKRENTLLVEQFYLDRMNKNRDLFYNIRFQVDALGFQRSTNQERLKKISEGVKKWWSNVDNQNKMKECSKNKHSKETRLAMSERAKKTMSCPIFKEKMRILNCGKKTSDETKKKLSQKAKEMWENPDIRNRICSAIKGVKKSEETKAKMSEASIKRHKDPDYKKRIVENFTDHTIREFLNLETGEVFVGTGKDFYNSYETLDRCSVSLLIHKKIHWHKEWILKSRLNEFAAMTKGRFKGLLTKYPKCLPYIS